MESNYVESTKMTKPMSVKSYRKAKLKILDRDFKIKLTEEEINRANSLTTEIQIDQFCMGIINSRWG